MLRDTCVGVVGLFIRQLYDRVLEEEREEGNLWSKIKRRAEAVSRVCMATGAAMATAGKAASSVSDKVVNQLASSVDKLRADVSSNFQRDSVPLNSSCNSDTFITTAPLRGEGASTAS